MKKVMCSCLMSLIVMLPLATYADAQLSDRHLERALHELDYAKRAIRQAKKVSDSHSRAQYHYDRMVDDINKIEAGITRVLHKPIIQPHVIAPIKGDYMTLVGKPS